MRPGQSRFRLTMPRSGISPAVALLCALGMLACLSLFTGGLLMLHWRQDVRALRGCGMAYAGFIIDCAHYFQPSAGGDGGVSGRTTQVRPHMQPCCAVRPPDAQLSPAGKNRLGV